MLPNRRYCRALRRRFRRFAPGFAPAKPKTQTPAPPTGAEGEGTDQGDRLDKLAGALLTLSPADRVRLAAMLTGHQGRRQGKGDAGSTQGRPLRRAEHARRLHPIGAYPCRNRRLAVALAQHETGRDRADFASRLGTPGRGEPLDGQAGRCRAGGSRLAGRGLSGQFAPEAVGLSCSAAGSGTGDADKLTAQTIRGVGAPFIGCISCRELGAWVPPYPINDHKCVPLRVAPSGTLTEETRPGPKAA